MGSFDLLYGEWAFMGGLGIVYFSCFIFVQMWLACHVEGGEDVVLLRNDGFCLNIRHISYEFFENVQKLCVFTMVVVHLCLCISSAIADVYVCM